MQVDIGRGEIQARGMAVIGSTFLEGVKAGAVLLLVALSEIEGFAQGTAFTYQGHLKEGTQPAAGVYDLRFELFSQANGGAAVGEAVRNRAATAANGVSARLCRVARQRCWCCDRLEGVGVEMPGGVGKCARRRGAGQSDWCACRECGKPSVHERGCYTLVQRAIRRRRSGLT